jgi:hypothetical protein
VLGTALYPDQRYRCLEQQRRILSHVKSEISIFLAPENCEQIGEESVTHLEHFFTEPFVKNNLVIELFPLQFWIMLWDELFPQVPLGPLMVLVPSFQPSLVVDNAISKFLIASEFIPLWRIWEANFCFIHKILSRASYALIGPRQILYRRF